MKDHQVIIGTRHEATCDPQLAATVAAILTRYGFEVHENVSGYTGGNIVVTTGQPQTRRVHALQLEIDPTLLIATTREGDHRGVPRTLQPRVAHRTARASHAGAGAGRRDAQGRMIADRAQTTSPTWLRSRDLGAAHIHVSPETGRVTALTSVRGTGCGTGAPSRGPGMRT
jgi:hypothetical protein